jgi:hypothetical protein
VKHDSSEDRMFWNAVHAFCFFVAWVGFLIPPSSDPSFFFFFTLAMQRSASILFPFLLFYDHDMPA